MSSASASSRPLRIVADLISEVILRGRPERMRAAYRIDLHAQNYKAERQGSDGQSHSHSERHT